MNYPRSKQQKKCGPMSFGKGMFKWQDQGWAKKGLSAQKAETLLNKERREARLATTSNKLAGG